ncbi:MAG: ABC transporter permease/substrate-binding protein [Phycisphaeraceae bacterium]
MNSWWSLMEGMDRLAAWHTLLVLVSIVLASAVSVPVGVMLARGRPRVRAAVLGAASVLQTIPGLAFLALIYMVLVGVNRALQAATGSDDSLFRSIGLLPTLIALTLYAVLPILRNTVVGIASIERGLLDAADGMGMTVGQRRWILEIPLAAPVILAGVRTATVWTVGIATLSTLIGQPSLGDPIIAGLQTLNSQQVIVGCLMAAGLAVVLDGVLGMIEHAMSKRRMGRALLGASVLLLAGLLAMVVVLDLGRGDRFEVGAKTFNESYVLGYLLGEQLGDDYDVAYRTGLGSTVAFEALRNDELDAYVDYSGTIWATLMKRTEPLGAEPLRVEVTRWLRDEHGVVCLGSLGFENAYALAVRRELAEELELETIDDLARHAGRLSIGGDPEFFGRAEWDRVRSLYGLGFDRQVSMQSTLMYQAVRDGEVDVITAYTTDAKIDIYDLVLLEDPRQAFPPYEALVLLGPRAGGDAQVVARLTPLIGTIDATLMREINRLVDEEGVLSRDAASTLRRRLVDQSLLSD